MKKKTHDIKREQKKCDAEEKKMIGICGKLKRMTKMARVTDRDPRAASQGVCCRLDVGFGGKL